MKALDTPIKRAGALVAVLGLVCFVSGAVAIGMDVYQYPPARAEFLAEWQAELDAKDSAVIAEVLRRAQANEPLPDLPSPAGVAELEDLPPTDVGARWTSGTQAAAPGREAVSGLFDLDLDGQRALEEDAALNPLDLSQPQITSWSGTDAAKAIAGAIEGAARYREHWRAQWRGEAVYFGARAALLGLFLWLLYEPTLGRLWRWIRHGSTYPVQRSPRILTLEEHDQAMRKPIDPKDWAEAIKHRTDEEENRAREIKAGIPGKR